MVVVVCMGLQVSQPGECRALGVLARPTRGRRRGSRWGRIVACDLKVAGVDPGVEQGPVFKDCLWTSSLSQRKCDWLIEGRPGDWGGGVRGGSVPLPSTPLVRGP